VVCVVHKANEHPLRRYDDCQPVIYFAGFQTQELLEFRECKEEPFLSQLGWLDCEGGVVELELWHRDDSGCLRFFLSLGQRLDVARDMRHLDPLLSLLHVVYSVCNHAVQGQLWEWNLA